jgi:DNA gyrase subunit A
MDPIEGLLPVNIEDEMRRSYLDYAMSVIVGRALPDIRDGLKPVHRRVLFAMLEEGLHHDRPYKKSARAVGQVIAKYHPHGDAAVYDTIVRMAQDFSMRYPLVDGQGNFGSVDGDPPAAMRYTEIRMERIAHEMVADLDKETVDFGPNYDGSEREPLVLPTRLPNLLVNGSSGIAVGMATNIPPHNLNEVVDALCMVIDRPEVGVDELLSVMPGPDFPTGGFIYGDGIREAYHTGRGRVIMRSRSVIEPVPRRDRENIVITEIPYQVNKSLLIQEIAALVNEKKITGIGDIRDESDREGIRIVIELQKGEVAEVIRNNLFKHTKLQTTFGVIFLAIVGGQPRILNLKELATNFIEFRKEVVLRRTAYELRKAEERAHILEGFVRALDQLDAVIATIRANRTPAEAKVALIEGFQFSAIQAAAILDMRLQRLTGLEREKILEEYRQTLQEIERLRAIVASEAMVLLIVREELVALKEQYGDARRTEILAEVKDLTIEELIAEEEMVITVSHTGYVKRTALSTYRSQRRGGKGRMGMGTRDEDFVAHLFVASTHSYILAFTSAGRCHWLKVYELPQVGPSGRGRPIVNMLQLGAGEKLAAMIAVKDFSEGGFVVMVTQKGTIKKTPLAAFSNPRAGGIIAVSIEAGDDLFSVKRTDGKGQIFLATRLGKAIRFREEDVRSMGRSARGVRGIRLRGADQLVEMDVLEARGDILTVTERGYGKRTPIHDYRLQGRGGSGIINIRTTERNGPVAAVLEVADEDQIMLVTAQGKIIRMNAADISKIGRATSGVRLIDLTPRETSGGEPPPPPPEGTEAAALAEKAEPEDAVVSVVRLAERDDEEPSAKPIAQGPEEDEPPPTLDELRDDSPDDEEDPGEGENGTDE